MSTKDKIAMLAKYIVAIVRAIHDNAPECGRCPLSCTSACLDNLPEEIFDIAEG